MASLLTAFAIAEASTLEMTAAASRVVPARISWAVVTSSLRMRFNTTRALLADMW
jgi:hypothetical protein